MPAAVTVDTAVAVEVTETLPSERKVQFHILSEFCKTVPEVRIESLRLSTALDWSCADVIGS